MIWILLAKLIFSHPSKMFHQCTPNIVHLANISTNFTDFEISCPNQYQQINIVNSTNIRRIIISEETKNISFFCDHNNFEQSLIIYGEPNVYFENNCHLKNLEIHGYPFFHKPVGSVVRAKNVQIYGNPNYFFPYRSESLIYVNESNSIPPKRKLVNSKVLEDSDRICYTDDQEFANKYCNGIITSGNTFNRYYHNYYIKFSQPMTFTMSQNFYYLNIFSDPQSSKTAITLEIQNSFSSNNLTLENIDITLSKTYNPITADLPLFKCVNSNIQLQPGITIESSKFILEDSTITGLNLELTTKSFYFTANTQQEISIASYTEDLQEIYICNCKFRNESYIH